MTIVFLTNFINHHQVPLGDEFCKLPGIQYYFIAMEELPLEFEKRGYPNYSDRSYLIKAYENRMALKWAEKLILSADVVIIGSADDTFIKERLKRNMLTFMYNERWFKQEKHLISPKGLMILYRDHFCYRKKKLYMLAASAYTANDVYAWGYRNKCFKWGYFPVVPLLNIENVLEQKKKSDIVYLVWCARFIDWKHPEVPVMLAAELKKKGYSFHLDMIGNGKLYENVQSMIEKLGLSNDITLLGNCANEKVRQIMLDAHIFLFTSDRNEGWGAVLNEAMSSGCAVIASNMIGAAPFLIKNGVNGYLYEDGNLCSLFEKIRDIIENPQKRECFAREAYYTMLDTWSPQKAACNFILLSQSLLNEGQIDIVSQGPCSIATPINPIEVLR